MLTHRQRMLQVLAGEMVDRLPYMPRLDQWHYANKNNGTLPRKYRNHTRDEIARAEGWALQKIHFEHVELDNPDAELHRAIGIYSTHQYVWEWVFPREMEIKVRREGDFTHVEYHTPVGMVSTAYVYTDDMKRRGMTISHVAKRIITRREDYGPVGWLFEHMTAVPAYERFRRWQEYIGEDGVASTGMKAGSPIHHIQKDFLDETEFYLHYKDYDREMHGLAERMTPVFEQILRICADSPAELVRWGGNYDDMLTYPPYFAAEIQPWIRKAAEVIGTRGKYVHCHCDGENQGLMELLRDSGMHMAESVCPAPMTKLPLDEYYRRWGDKLTICGGIPSDLLIPQFTPEEKFEGYLDYLFRAVAPGRHMIVAITDTVTPSADFDRLVRIGERIEQEGRLPLEAGAFRPVSATEIGPARPAPKAEPAPEGAFRPVAEGVIAGDGSAVLTHVRALLARGVLAEEILNRGLIAGMDVVGADFRSGKAFIPEVLLSARAMNEAIDLLGPHFSQESRAGRGRVLLGTVWGDMHNIGKNMVSTMLRGAGFEVKDLGINVPRDDFVSMVAEYKPNILGLSSLLTTTMPEMKRVIDGLAEKDLRGKVKVIVGGAPVNAQFAREIGADGYAPNAGDAVSLAKSLLAAGRG